MAIIYSQKQSTAQKKDVPTAFSVLDVSSQSESLQRKADMANNATQRAEAPRPNNTGMPDNLKSGIESLSGLSMDDVRVHYNSSKPATVQALAYTQGTDIHVAPGQEKHLPHEAWHVAQQMAGRVSPTTNINGMPVNDNAALEHEADVMGNKAVTQRYVCSNKPKCTNRGENVSQMIRVINAYEQFSLPRPKEPLINAKRTMREMYRAKFENAFNSFWLDPTSKINQKRAKRYCASITINLYNPSKEDKGKKEAYTRYLHVYKNFRKKLFQNKIRTSEWIGINETLVVVAHGNEKSTLFANLSPRELAKKISVFLPNGYKGMIFLAGCHTGERNQQNNKAYIEDFALRLNNCGMQKIGTEHKSRFGNFIIKGNKNTARSTEKGEFVKAGGGMRVLGTAEKEKIYGDGRYYKGRKSKMYVSKKKVVRAHKE